MTQLCLSAEMVLEDDLVTEHTEADQASVAFIQLVFRARLVKRAVRKLSENVLRAKQPIYTTPELLEILHIEPGLRSGEQLDELLHTFHHLPFFQTLSELQQAVCSPFLQAPLVLGCLPFVT